MLEQEKYQPRKIDEGYWEKLKRRLFLWGALKIKEAWRAIEEALDEFNETNPGVADFLRRIFRVFGRFGAFVYRSSEIILLIAGAVLLYLLLKNCRFPLRARGAETAATAQLEQAERKEKSPASLLEEGRVKAALSALRVLLRRRLGVGQGATDRQIMRTLPAEEQTKLFGEVAVLFEKIHYAGETASAHTVSALIAAHDKLDEALL